MLTALRASISFHLLIGLLIRLAAVAYSAFHDASNLVKYTDIDYSVYSDGAAYVVKGLSPYLRETYRYTPILAWALTPNVTGYPSYGKILFSLFDILTAYLIYLLSLEESKGNKSQSRVCAYLWIYNPLPIVICSRGSAESIILSLVLATLFLTKKKATLLAGLVYGFSVHFKIYPAVYCVSLYLCTTKGLELDPKSLKSLSVWKNLVTISSYRVRLVLGAVLGFFIPTALCYYFYGQEFLEETYLYHLTRKDIKHNFSNYFYMLYLNWNAEGIASILLSLITFAPQFGLILATALLFRAEEDLTFAVFVETYLFVIFNKVATSQYFLWYLSLLPVLYSRLNMKFGTVLILLFVWYFAQIAWLLPAYFLEFEGRNAFMYVWLESVAFFCANVGILVQIVKNYRPSSSS